ncbi:hypothetical protein RRG08_034593 [Elysia crispata]|uniref:Uncharacterized protein n=1 Tax=Elysia crispata TaxID=231223 RepID=A0AAE1E8M7_9GAST|nr:hypothetical protein RRG08_034593 [Elysia crispata]
MGDIMTTETEEKKQDNERLAGYTADQSYTSAPPAITIRNNRLDYMISRASDLMMNMTATRGDAGSLLS